ncbi:MAG: Flp pilus assembly protein CpaB [Planctomycetes bacterium]|nr:Flp pilus assembly protein CpaB [Planctomycetota bacterium]
MRVKSMVLVTIAMVCGLLATIGISQVIDRQNRNQVATEMVKIFVAAADVDIGAALNAQNVKLEEWPKDRIPEGAVTKLEDLENRFARQRLFPGEPILTIKLMDSNADTTLTIPEGYRAASIKVSGEVVVGNLVKPGDRVDVIVFLRRGSDVPFTGTRTILRDVRVWAVNAKTERSVDDQGQPTMAQTVSLLVTPKQVELLTLASELGQLRLSLRRPNDLKETTDEGTDVDSFLAEGAQPRHLNHPSASPQSDAKPSSHLFDLLEQMKKGPSTAEAPVSILDPAASAPKVEVNPVRFSMFVHSPQGLVRYDWMDEEDVPQMVSLIANPASAPAAFGPPPASGSAPPSGGTGVKSDLDDKAGTKINVP